MEFAKEMVVPAALSELLGRIFSFLLDNFPRPAAGRDAHRKKLEQLLGSVGSMVEEAEGRHITNQQLLSDLKALTEGMYRGRFALDTMEFDSNDDGSGSGDDAAARRSFALSSSFNSAKRSRVSRLLFGGGDADGDRLSSVTESLESLTCEYMREFILLVQGYPRRVHRPVATTLYMDMCVFGRHVETERIVNFLLQPATPATPYLSVLTVIGGKKVGKTTLVRHACNDERVRGHFPLIEFFETHDVVKEGGLLDQTMWESDGPEFLTGVRRIIGKEKYATARSLLVFDDAWCIDETAWKALSCSSPSPMAGGSKIIFTGRDKDLALLGTTEPVELKHLPQEEYWYYFKAFAFGGTDPKEHPRMAAVGKEIAGRLEMFLEARVLGALLRSNFDARFWYGMWKAVKCSERRPLHVGVLLDLLPVHGRLQSYGYCREPPVLTLQDVLSGGAGNGNGGLEGKKDLTIHLCRETLYMDHWYSITFKEEAAHSAI